jgi:uncharacterized protein YdeI (BOF family)
MASHFRKLIMLKKSLRCGQQVEAKDTVEIRGELDRDWAVSVEIEADSLTKL